MSSPPPTWTPLELTVPLTPELLSSQGQNTAAYLNARKAYVTQPTDSVIVTVYGEVIYSRDPIAPHAISYLHDATFKRIHLLNLGMDPLFTVWNNEPQDSVHYAEWHDNRRLFQVGPMSIGLLMLRYATELVTVADEMTIQELINNKMMKK